ncbi:MAG: peptidoglycan DD-metalloendopeptidase family protein [Desulfobacterales bacterium]
MKKGYILSFGLCCLAAIMMAASDGFAARFSYYGPGNLISGSGTGRVDYKVWFAGMRHPIELWPSYANSQVYRPGGMYGGGGGECDSSNYSYPWRDNFCETRGYRTPLCPSGYGHQGQDIRPRACRDNTYWAVATENGRITSIGSYSVYLQGDSGFRHTYLHLHENSIAVYRGKYVKKGDRIGRVSDNFGSRCGGTDCTTVHLHYDLKSGGIIYPPYMSLIRAYEDLISNVFLMDTNYDGRHDRLQAYGNGNRETEYLVGDWDGDRRSNIAVRRWN